MNTVQETRSDVLTENIKKPYNGPKRKLTCEEPNQTSTHANHTSRFSLNFVF